MEWITRAAVAGITIFALVLFGAGVAAQTVSNAPAMHEPLVGHALFDQFEHRVRDGEDVIAWDGQAWYGGDYHKVFVKTLGGISGGGDDEQAEIQLLYSRLIGYFWDVQAGIRYDFYLDPSRTYGVVGLQGLAPGFFEFDLQGFISNKGTVSVRLEAEYDLLITQRLVLQPKAEVNLAAQNVRELGIGSGVNDVELGLRLRYEIRREFAPYIGVYWGRKLGETAAFARNEKESAGDLSFIAGIRFWY